MKKGIVNLLVTSASIRPSLAQMNYFVALCKTDSKNLYNCHYRLGFRTPLRAKKRDNLLFASTLRAKLLASIDQCGYFFNIRCIYVRNNAFWQDPANLFRHFCFSTLLQRTQDLEVRIIFVVILEATCANS